MQAISIPISHHRSKKINVDVLDDFDLIITLCEDVRAKCPYFKSKAKHIHWDIEDPASFNGDKKDTFNKYVEVSDIIVKKINDFNNKLEQI